MSIFQGLRGMINFTSNNAVHLMDLCLEKKQMGEYNYRILLLYNFSFYYDVFLRHIQHCEDNNLSYNGIIWEEAIC